MSHHWPAGLPSQLQELSPHELLAHYEPRHDTDTDQPEAGVPGLLASSATGDTAPSPAVADLGPVRYVVQVLRGEGPYDSHISYWRKAPDSRALARPAATADTVSGVAHKGRRQALRLTVLGHARSLAFPWPRLPARRPCRRAPAENPAGMSGLAGIMEQWPRQLCRTSR